MKIFWEKVDEKVPSGEELDRLRGYCKRSSFRNALNVSLCVKLISFNLYRKIEDVIDERNDVVHQLWIYEHRSNARVLRKTLEMFRK